MQQTYTEKGRKTTKEIINFVEGLGPAEQDRFFDFIDGYMMAMQIKAKAEEKNNVKENSTNV